MTERVAESKDPVQPRNDRLYAAFISYSHADNKAPGRQWASWLHQALEAYEVPHELAGGNDERGGKVPASLYPVFRDEEELPADADLSANIRAALRRSQLLVVVCSPRAVASRFVAEEIRYYKELGRSDRILALIVAGVPNAAEDLSKQSEGLPQDLECLPAPLRYGVPLEDGKVDWKARAEPIAADVRPEGSPAEGWTSAGAYRSELEAQPHANKIEIEQKARNYDRRLELAKLKIIAGALRVPLGTLTQRDKAMQLERARGRARVLRRWLAIVGVLGLLAVIAAAFAWQQRSVAEQRQREAEVAQLAAEAAERQTRWRASKADTDIALELAGRGEDAQAMALVSRALELNENNEIASLLAYRLLTDGRLTLPEFLISTTSVPITVTFSKDGRWLAVGCEDGAVIVTDLTSGQKISLGAPLGNPIEKLAFSPDGLRLAIAARSTVSLWEFRSNGLAIPILEDFTARDVLELAWPRADRIVVHSGRTWGSHDRLTQVIAPGSPRWRPLCVIGDGLALDAAKLDNATRASATELHPFQTWVAESAGMLVLHDVRGHSLTWLDLQNPELRRPIFRIDVEEESQILVAAESGVAVVEKRPASENLTYDWADPAAGIRRTVRAEKGSAIEKISPDGTRLLVGTTSGAALMDRQTGSALVEHFWRSEGAANLISLSREGSSWVLVPRQAAREAGLTIAQVFGDSVLQEKQLALPARAVDSAFDAPGNWICIAGEDNAVRVWARAAIQRLPPSLEASRANTPPTNPPEGLFCEEHTVFRRNPGSVEKQVVSRLKKPAAATADPTGYAFSPDSRRVVVTYGSTSDRPDNNAPSVAVLYDVTTGEPVGAPMAHDDDVFSPRFSPGGEWFVTASDDFAVRRWSGLTAAALGPPLRFPSRVRYLEVSPGGETIVTGSGFLIDTAKWSIARKLSSAQRPPGGVAQAFFSADGRWLATASGGYTKRGNRREVNYTALAQWETASGAIIGQPIEIPLGTKFDWAKQGETLTSPQLVWRCALGGSGRAVQPLLQAFRPVALNAEDDQTVNRAAAQETLSFQKIFPQGQTSENAAVCRLAEKLFQRFEPRLAPVPPQAPRLGSAPAPQPTVDLAAEEAKADQRLNSAYSNVRGALNASGKEALKREQLDWLKRRDSIPDPSTRLRFIEQRILDLDRRNASGAR